MPAWGPVSRRVLVRTLRDLGFDPHRGDIGLPLLTRVLAQAGVSRDEWEAA